MLSTREEALAAGDSVARCLAVAWAPWPSEACRVPQHTCEPCGRLRRPAAEAGKRHNVSFKGKDAIPAAFVGAYPARSDALLLPRGQAEQEQGFVFVCAFCLFLPFCR